MIALLLLIAAPDEALVSRVDVACATIDRALGVVRSSYALEQADSIEAFVARTGRARFEAAATLRKTIWLQPSAVLDRLPDLDLVLRHECVHAILRARGVPPLDVVLEEAVALELSGQASKLPPARAIASEEHDAIVLVLRSPKDRLVFEAAVARAAATHGAQIRAWMREGALISALSRQSGSARRSPAAPSLSGSAPRPPR